jgi:hypothetical protein
MILINLKKRKERGRRVLVENGALLIA